jgi:DNA polymerase-3 subunit delta
MLIFLYGPDTFRLSRKLGQIIEEYKKRASGFGFSVFDAQESDVKDFFSGMRQNSLFPEKKFIVVKNPISNKDFKELLIDNFSAVAGSGHNVVFCQEGKVLKTDRLLSVFKKNAEIQEFIPLEGDKLEAWVSREFDGAGSSADEQAVRALARKVGSDLWRAENEVQKLAHFITGRRITAEDVEKNVVQTIDSNIFKTIDAVASRDKKQAIRLIREHVDKGDHPLYLLSMIATQFKNLVMVKSGGVSGGAARLGIHPYVFGKTVAQARSFGLDELTNIYHKVCQTDFDVKTGRVSPEAGLDLLIARI